MNVGTVQLDLVRGADGLLRVHGRGPGGLAADALQFWATGAPWPADGPPLPVPGLVLAQEGLMVELRRGGEHLRVAADDLRRGVVALLDARHDPGTPRILRREPWSGWASAGDLVLARALQARVAAMEALAPRARTAEELADLAARRRFWLILAEDAGLHCDRHAEERCRLFEREGLPRLIDHHRAALAALVWLASPERKELGLPVVNRLVGAPVSVEWFLTPAATPAEYSPAGWLAACEQALGGIDTGTAYQGAFDLHDGQRWHQVFWRCDDDATPAIYGSRPRFG